MKKNFKILIAGVGGQGIVYLTNILVEAAVLLDIPVSVSEIHGLSQRGGVVTSGIGLGKHNTGFVGKANVDFLFGLEPLETQRCITHLHKSSSVIFGNYKIAPYAVNAEMAAYPDMNVLAAYLAEQCKEVVYTDKYPSDIDAVLYNVFLLGRSTHMKMFPFSAVVIEQAIRNTVLEYHLEKTLSVFRRGVNYKAELQSV